MKFAFRRGRMTEWSIKLGQIASQYSGRRVCALGEVGRKVFDKRSSATISLSSLAHTIICTRVYARLQTTQFMTSFPAAYAYHHQRRRRIRMYKRTRECIYTKRPTGCLFSQRGIYFIFKRRRVRRKQWNKIFTVLIDCEMFTAFWLHKWLLDMHSVQCFWTLLLET